MPDQRFISHKVIDAMKDIEYLLDKHMAER